MTERLPMKGIIVASDATQESLLPFFYLNLRLCSDLPITFFDFGMSIIGREFCQKRGAVITLDQSLISSKNLIKTMWFKKPLAFHQTPYETTLWIDIDCKIRKPLDDLFTFKAKHSLKIYQDPHALDAHARHQTKHPTYRDFNSGVVVFKKGSPLIEEWISKSQIGHRKVRGDQEILSLILLDHLDQVEPLLYSDNHLLMSHIGYPFDQSRIIHYYSNAKEILSYEYHLLMTRSLKKLASPPHPQVSRNFIKILKVHT